VTQLTLEGEKVGVPGTVIVAPGFVTCAKLWGAYQGVQAVRTSVYPGAFELHTDEELIENTEEVVFPQIIENLTTAIDESELVVVEKPIPREIVFKGTIDEVNDFFTAAGWGDGMAIVPPTIERVEEFLKYTDLSPDEEIAIVQPSLVRATPWVIAVNGVMAGCRPEYMPILIAMIEGMAQGSRNYSSTHSWVPYILVNGPLAEQLGIDHGQGLITDPVNTVLGRACSLFVRNIFGLRVKELRMGSFGYVQSWTLAEDPEYLDLIGWKPYHVQNGFGINQSTVSAATSVYIGGNLIPAEPDPDIILQLIAFDAINKGYAFGGASTICLSPPVAKILADANYTKETVSEYLSEVARKITYTYTFAQVYGSPGFQYPPFEEQLAKNLESAQEGLLPPWYPRFPGWEDIKTTPALRRPLQIIVTGDPSRNKSQTLGGDSLGTPFEVRLPANWAELMEELGYPPLESFYR
jgi:hypothetical protein